MEQAMKLAPIPMVAAASVRVSRSSALLLWRRLAAAASCLLFMVKVCVLMVVTSLRN
jgi:hypothetical protein